LKNENQPLARNYFKDASQCGAHSRRTGKPCRQPAMPDGRCRMHGGKSTGDPKGNTNALKNGFYTKDAIEQGNKWHPDPLLYVTKQQIIYI